LNATRTKNIQSFIVLQDYDKFIKNKVQSNTVTTVEVKYFLQYRD